MDTIAMLGQLQKVHVTTHWQSDDEIQFSCVTSHVPMPDVKSCRCACPPKLWQGQLSAMPPWCVSSDSILQWQYVSFSKWTNIANCIAALSTLSELLIIQVRRSVIHESVRTSPRDFSLPRYPLARRSCHHPSVIPVAVFPMGSKIYLPDHCSSGLLLPLSNNYILLLYCGAETHAT